MKRVFENMLLVSHVCHQNCCEILGVALQQLCESLPHRELMSFALVMVPAQNRQLVRPIAAG